MGEGEASLEDCCDNEDKGGCLLHLDASFLGVDEDALCQLCSAHNDGDDFDDDDTHGCGVGLSLG